MRPFRRRPKVVAITCCRCGIRMLVVQDSVPDQERLCNSCVPREKRGRGAPATFLP